jgi:hypothetical protein
MACCIFLALILGLVFSVKSVLFGKPKNQAIAWRLSAKIPSKGKGNIHE